MSDWNPSLYLHFAAERSRPAVELLARVPPPDAVAPGDYRLGDRHWITSVVTGSDRERTAAFSYALPSDAGRAISPPGERTDIAGISASVYCCPPYGVIITSAGNGDREEFSLEFLLHRSSVTGQFQ